MPVAISGNALVSEFSKEDEDDTQEQSGGG
jgi:hypothetical protein